MPLGLSAGLRYNMHMIFQMLRWWYGPGWLQAIHRITALPLGVERHFSVSLLAQTLFSPWRRIVSMGGRGLDAKVRDALDNFVSRCVGFVVRSIVLFTALGGMIGAFIFGIILTVVWPLLPLFIVYCVIRGIIG
jgi:hypothetical protein